jgi:hypothetical protein
VIEFLKWMHFNNIIKDRLIFIIIIIMSLSFAVTKKSVTRNTAINTVFGGISKRVLGKTCAGRGAAKNVF